MITSFDIAELSNEHPDEGLDALQKALDSRDLSTHLHSLRVVCYAARLGRMMGLKASQLSTLQVGVVLHDIGKVHVPEQLLRKAGPLSDEEWKVMKRHAAMGYGMVSIVPSLRDAAAIVLAHHEWFDGRGYPHGLKGEDIPVGARILSVVDALDAMTAEDRPYRQTLSMDIAVERIQAKAGSQFDPAVVEAFTAISLQEWQLLRSSMTQCLHLGQ
jgi:HD-GYP domain-containing protein (c-di-GMP phosphodiesterase class II)